MAGDTSCECAEGAYCGVRVMSALVFPFGIRFLEDGKLDIFPALEAEILGRGKNGIRALFLIDSGASTSLLPSGDAGVLGIRMEEGKKTIVRSIGDSPFLGYVHTMRFRFGGCPAFQIPVLIADRPDVPRILGREGVFSRFGIVFDEPMRRTALLDSKKDRKVLDSVFE